MSLEWAIRTGVDGSKIPLNLCGVSPRAMASPPVLIVERNHANVKCLSRSRMLTFCGCVTFTVSLRSTEPLPLVSEPRLFATDSILAYLLGDVSFDLVVPCDVPTRDVNLDHSPSQSERERNII